jgi:hypothetical protein
VKGKSCKYVNEIPQRLESALSLTKSLHLVKKLQKDIKKAKILHDKAFRASLVS